MSWLGFEHGGDFLAIVKGDLPAARMTKLKNIVVRGLHTIQGLQTRSNETNLHLVDPAFGKATVHAAIIARKINISKIKLLSKSRTWLPTGGNANKTMVSAVDWLEREIVIRVDQDAGDAAHFALDLMTFDCISRAAAGFLATEFYSHDVRRIKTFLGRLAESGSDQDQDIDLFLHGALRTVSIDDGIIQVGGGY